MTDLRKAAEMALEALNKARPIPDSDKNIYAQSKAMSALRFALAQPEQEPPPWWTTVEKILEEYGLQAVDFVADFNKAMGQPEQEPVAWLDSEGRFSYFKHLDSDKPLYTAPPKREWVGLTAKDLAEIPPSCFEGAIWADAKLKEKNT